MSIYKLPGSAIQANTISVTQLQTTVVTQIQSGASGGPKVKSLIYPSNDTAANSTGGQTVYITGSGFAANAQVLVNGAAVPSQSFISASNISFTTPALSTGTYPVYVINPEDGGTAILYPGLLISGEPTWVTSAGSLSASQDELISWSYSLSATGDTPITYALAAGNTLPTGISLAANGLISGTVSSPTGNATTYTFSVIATDAQNQDSTRQFTVTTSTGEGVLFANNVLLIHADGTNNQNNHTFLDSSNNNFTITRNGNATQGSFSPFSQTGWSAFFDGTGDYLTVADNAALQMGSGDFTIEFWMQPTSTGVATVFGKGFTASGAILMQTLSTSGRIELWVNGSLVITESSGTYSPNNWYHIAVVRSGTSLVLYRNGVSTGSVTNSVNLNSTASLGIGGDPTNLSYTFTGYISNFRMVKGSALYTTTFTTPASPLTNIANTSLLTLQSNRFIDNSTNAFTVTRNGDTSIQAWSPFAPTAAYSTANVGGSGYFDGTDDYLRITDNAAFDFGSGDFTIECWAYTETFASQYNVLVCQWGSSTAWIFRIQSTLIGLYANIGGTQNYTASVTNTTGQWDHFAVTRSGTTLTFYKNGVSVGTTSISGTINNAAETISIGVLSEYNSTTTHKGYISGLRVIKGSAIAPTITSPPTNIANTSLLCNFTNAGIFDQTAKNVLETVGDAKVSTAQYKYGTGSMYFDGTGDRVHTGPSNPLISLGTGNFTVECWVNKLDTNHRGIWQISSTAGGLQASTSNLALGYQTGVWQIYRNGNSESASYSITPNTWYHTAVVRNSGTTKLYVNGTEVISVADTNNYTGTYMVIGGYYDTNYLHNGYIDDLRITKGYARYTSNFTAPTSALKDK
jgi:hypothetical protein